MEYIVPIFSIILLYIIYSLFGRAKKFPNVGGPPGSLLTGNALQMRDNVPYFLHEWAKKYGDIMKINIFGKNIIVANTYEAINQVLVTKSEDFAGRPENYRLKLFFKNEDFVFVSISPKWSLMKSTSMHGLKQTSKQLEEFIMERTEIFLNRLKSYEGQAMDVINDINSIISYITFTQVFGHGLSEADQKEYKILDELIMDCTSPNADNAVLDLVPFLRGPWFSPWRKTKAIADRVHRFHKHHVEQSLSSYVEGEVNCVMDSLMAQMYQTVRDGSTDVITLDNMAAVGLDLAIGGNHTTTYSLYYFVLLMAAHQEVQAEAHAEVIKVIGQRPPTLMDRPDIPYVESVIYELLRLNSITYLALPHATMRDTTLMDHSIPQGTEVWVNLWHQHHDENIWEDPWKFKPKRFLDDNGKMIPVDSRLRRQFFAFSAGRRVCAGEFLARNRLFLLTTSLLQKFRFVPPEGVTLDTDPRNMKSDFSARPHNFKVRVLQWDD